MKDNKFIQSVLARSIMDIDFMNALAGKAKKKKAEEHIFNASVKGLKYFSGFIAKVQHNFLWNDFMLTRKMLIRQKIELEVFTAYLPEHQNNKRNKIPGEKEKIMRFVSFLKNYLEQRPQRRYRLVYNVLLHEEAMFILKQHSDDVAFAAATGMLPRKILFAHRPVLSGAVHHVWLTVPPPRMNDLFKKNGEGLLQRRRRYYCYWYDPGSSAIRILEIPVVIRRVLTVIDNKKKVKDIVQYFSGRMHPDDTRFVLEHLCRMKMISLN
jgi:hypothetical protein